ncbi:MAG TPA: transporter substrate-binding domain-containing protein, partial [Rheinheimera sp.]|nr:transporter substrate-binding domain-containing protein [Rheinheimera sp.]
MSTHWFAVILLLASVSSDANISGTETLSGPAKAQPALLNNTSPVLRFVVYYPHFPPYIYMEPPQNQVIGIIPDLLAPLFQQLGISVEYLLDNRAGAEKRLYKGDVDAMMLSADWATHPEQLLFSDAIIPYHDYLFARSEQELQQLPQQLHGKKICTREYYVYPELEPLFSADTLVRIDSSSQEAQLRMVFNQ